MKASLLLRSLFYCTVAVLVKSQASKVRRERNLDHLDIPTLSYYLGIDSTTYELNQPHAHIGHDVAVMFYAQWDENSRRFAPYWDSIATHVKAGTKASNIILGLFHCEADSAHRNLCKAIGVKKYPTLMFIGAGTFPDPLLVGGSKGTTNLPHTVQFVGNWQYGDAVLDWVNAMQSISRWNQWGWIKHVRRSLLGAFMKQPKNTEKLAVGLPVGSATSPGTADSSFTTAQMALFEKKLELLGNESKSYKKMAVHAGILLESTLFPPSKKDPFTVLTENKGWNNTQDSLALVVKSCALELSLDYCVRLSSYVATQWVENVYNASKEYTNYTAIDEELKAIAHAREPFCGQFDVCLAGDFSTEQCQPSKCPFNDEVACRYLSSCFDEEIQYDYAVSLKLIKEGDDFPPKKALISAKKSSDSKSTTAGGWGVAA